MTLLDQLLIQGKAGAMRPHDPVYRQLAAREARAFAESGGAFSGSYMVDALVKLMLAGPNISDRVARISHAQAVSCTVDAIRAERAQASRAAIAARPARMHWAEGANV